jgi:hypothetical protein
MPLSSNALICISALLRAGLLQLIAALVFLVVIHRLEYFLNGKIAIRGFVCAHFVFFVAKLFSFCNRGYPQFLFARGT